MFSVGDGFVITPLLDYILNLFVILLKGNLVHGSSSHSDVDGLVCYSDAIAVTVSFMACQESTWVVWVWLDFGDAGRVR